MRARRRRGGVEAEDNMKPSVTTERRREQRVDARLQIELQLDPSESRQTSSTINISSNGVYFHSSRPIAPLTKLGLRLYLPDEDPVDCQGVVVRCLPESANPNVQQYEVACYFLDLDGDFRALLRHYVQSHL
jgi:hypothetical protein